MSCELMKSVKGTKIMTNCKRYDMYWRRKILYKIRRKVNHLAKEVG